MQREAMTLEQEAGESGVAGPYDEEREEHVFIFQAENGFTEGLFFQAATSLELATLRARANCSKPLKYFGSYELLEGIVKKLRCLDCLRK